MTSLLVPDLGVERGLKELLGSSLEFWNEWWLAVSGCDQAPIRHAISDVLSGVPTSTFLTNPNRDRFLYGALDAGLMTRQNRSEVRDRHPTRRALMAVKRTVLQDFDYIRMHLAPFSGT